MPQLLNCQAEIKAGYFYSRQKNQLPYLIHVPQFWGTDFQRKRCKQNISVSHALISLIYPAFSSLWIAEGFFVSVRSDKEQYSNRFIERGGANNAFQGTQQAINTIQKSANYSKKYITYIHNTQCIAFHILNIIFLPGNCVNNSHINSNHFGIKSRLYLIFTPSSQCS